MSPPPPLLHSQVDQPHTSFSFPPPLLPSEGRTQPSLRPKTSTLLPPPTLSPSQGGVTLTLISQSMRSKVESSKSQTLNNRENSHKLSCSPQPQQPFHSSISGAAVPCTHPPSSVIIIVICPSLVTQKTETCSHNAVSVSHASLSESTPGASSSMQ